MRCKKVTKKSVKIIIIEITFLIIEICATSSGSEKSRSLSS